MERTGCFDRLQQEEQFVNDILDHVGTTQSNVSQHIEVLGKAGVIRSVRRHNKVYCFLQSNDVMPLIGQIKKIFCQKGVVN